MTKMRELEREVEKLTPQELIAFREWFANYDSEQWDKQLERDVLAGKLDKLAKEALRDHEAGRSKEL